MTQHRAKKRKKKKKKSTSIKGELKDEEIGGMRSYHCLCIIDEAEVVSQRLPLQVGLLKIFNLDFVVEVTHS